MKERILQFLKAENKSSSQFADEIGVQPSGISHILSGRNNPSLDFVLKMLETYNYISTEWLLFAKGNMYKDKSLQKLSDELPLSEPEDLKDGFSDNDEILKNMVPEAHMNEGKKSSVNKTEKIVFFYSDNSFREYVPRTD
ncbi:MAG TPA: helix-turn-helix transcriptional regulator [Bacteroidales bacterium]|nr:helix-turn-helix transcriptional regulator [Bacteroidales bacterium]HPR12041.1 helix-turn-helix transcriptional regulator [Bacteroidales bacterium]